MADTPSTVTLTIDGREVTVPRGTPLLKAAKQAGQDVPHYCYHEGLSSPAMCRLCLVEVEGAPKPMPSCVTQATNGQVVKTQSPLALEMREGVLEFYALNHPLDCPICDMSGECFFQNYIHAEGRDHGRSVEPKRVFGRDDFGGDVLFYGDRCVMCTRCVRFMNEMERDSRLTVVERGNRSVIDTFFEKGLEGTHWHGNIVDLCPVGALVSKDFLYKARAWDLAHTPSICPSCSQGCNIELHTRDNLVQRVKPRQNLEVNGWWMCDYGRLNYEWINHGHRLEAPLVREDGAAKATGWKDALVKLLELAGAAAGKGVKAVASPFASNEDLAAFTALVRELGGGPILYRSARADAEIPLKGYPGLARRKDLSPNATGAELLGLNRVGGDDGRGGLEDVAGHDGILLVLGDSLHDQPAGFGGNAALYAYFGARGGAATGAAHVVLPITTFAEQEGTFTNFQGWVQRFWPALTGPGAARPAWFALGALVAQVTGTDVIRSAGEAFARMAQQVPAFAGMTYDDLGKRGAVVNEPVPLSGD
ncbi:MAG: 2Fe-2S iron-sulfur cluster binding domain-containing protein [Gemmatimonadetes bacterium]|nr:2Fe-2S iron-sulfur cluster binding domain-containing protein [Gemmatimonadota bacterium]